MVTTGLGELLGIDRTENFTRVMGEMRQRVLLHAAHDVQCGRRTGRWAAFSTARAPSSWRLFWPFCWRLSCWRRAAGAGRTAWTALWSTLGFAAFYIFTGFTYVYVFSEERPEMTDYNRYIYPYYAGWLVLAVPFCAAALKHAKPGALMHWALLALAAVCIWRVDAPL